MFLKRCLQCGSANKIKTVHNEISFNYNKLLHISHIIQDETFREAGINYWASEH